MKILFDSSRQKQRDTMEQDFVVSERLESKKVSRKQSKCRNLHRDLGPDPTAWDEARKNMVVVELNLDIGSAEPQVVSISDARDTRVV
jgi:hypothetical protein